MVRPRLVHLTTVDSSLVHLLLPQLRAFRDTGFEVIGVSAAGPHASALEAEGIRHVPLRYATRSNAPWRDAAALVEFWWQCRRLQPDVVHTHNPKPGVWGRIAARLAGVPRVVNTVHGLYATTEDPWLRRTVVYLLERLASAFSDAELLQNVEDLPVLRRLGVPAAKLVVMGNGIDLARFDPSTVSPEARAQTRAAWQVQPESVVIGAVGRLVGEKGWRELFVAVTALRDEGVDVTLVAIGPTDPAKPDALSREELDAAQAAGVVLPGWQDDIETQYPGFDLFCLPSWREGFPRAAMEAAAMGLAIVATDIRGCRQVVDDGVTGTLVPVRAPVALADALRELATDVERRRRYGLAGRERASRTFDVRTQINASLLAYGSATHEARAHREKLKRGDSSSGPRSHP
jgi:glycosyltransferase involved in cell wall biosynthesis